MDNKTGELTMLARDFVQRAERVTPGGSQTRSKRGLFTSVTYAEQATGMVDWIAGLAAMGLGPHHPIVEEAVIRQIRDTGPTMSLPSLLEVQAAEELCAALKWPEMVRWVKTGSEATEAAMMVARAYTGRHRVLSVGYHGWHIAHQANMHTDVVDVPWGDLDILEARLRGSYVAAVLLEPMRDHEPPKGYLEDVEALCLQYGTLLVLDEMVTGFRWALGGAGEYYGIIPDLACFGKAMANGYALAALVGPRRIMDGRCDGISSTFGGEAVGLAACRAALEVYQSEPVIEHLWHIGNLLKLQSPVPMTGSGVHPRFKTTVEWPQRDPEIVALCERAATRGVLFHPAGLNPMYCHTVKDVTTSVEAMR